MPMREGSLRRGPLKLKRGNRLSAGASLSQTPEGLKDGHEGEERSDWEPDTCFAVLRDSWIHGQPELQLRQEVGRVEPAPR